MHKYLDEDANNLIGLMAKHYGHDFEKSKMYERLACFRGYMAGLPDHTDKELLLIRCSEILSPRVTRALTHYDYSELMSRAQYIMTDYSDVKFCEYSVNERDSSGNFSCDMPYKNKSCKKCGVNFLNYYQ